MVIAVVPLEGYENCHAIILMNDIGGQGGDLFVDRVNLVMLCDVS